MNKSNTENEIRLGDLVTISRLTPLLNNMVAETNINSYRHFPPDTLGLVVKKIDSSEIKGCLFQILIKDKLLIFPDHILRRVI